MFKIYLEALTDVGKAKMNILDKSSLLNRKKNWADIGQRKPAEKIKLVLNPTSQQLESFGWIVPEWSKSDTFSPGENIGYVRGVIYFDKFVKKVVLTVVDSSVGNDIIHEHIIEELRRVGRLEKTEPLGPNDYYDEDIEYYLCVIQNGTKLEFDLSESYTHDMNGDKDSQEWINKYKEDGGQYKINNSLSKMYTNDLMDEVDGWGPPEDEEVEEVADMMVEFVSLNNGKLLDKFKKKKGGYFKLLSAIRKKYKSMLEEEDLDKALVLFVIKMQNVESMNIEYKFLDLKDQVEEDEEEDV